jgi:hypothetical protein
MAHIFHFGLGRGHLPVRRTQKIAKKHGAELVNFTEPGTGNKRHWFNTPNTGYGTPQLIANAVLNELRAEGILA